MDLQCRIIEVLPEQVGNNWVKHQFIAETVGQYPKKVKFDVWGDERWQKMQPYVVPDKEVKVSFDVESKEWNGRWFTNLSAFSVYAGAQAQNGHEGSQAPESRQQDMYEGQAHGAEPEQDLPF